MKNINALLFIISCIAFSACDKVSTVDTIDELTVQAFLHVGQSLDSIKFGKVIPLDSLQAFPAPNELQPKVITEDGEIIDLTYSGIDGIYGNLDLIIEQGKTYKLEVDYNGKTVSAETFTPSPPKNLTLSDAVVEMAKIESFQDLQNQVIPDPLEINWEAEEGAYYFIKVKNIEEDPEFVNNLFASSDFQRPDFLTEPSINNFYTINTFRDITHFGTYEVIIYRVNPEYLALYEDNTNGSGSLNEIRTNVQDGYGIFTGVNSDTIYFEAKEL